MTNKRIFTASHIKYLLAMLKLYHKEQEIRCIRLATEMGLSKVSIHNMLKVLAGMNLLTKNNEGVSYFTDEGYEIALRYQNYFDAVSGLLGLHLSADTHTLEDSVIALISTMPRDNLNELCITE